MKESFEKYLLKRFRYITVVNKEVFYKHLEDDLPFMGVQVTPCAGYDNVEFKFENASVMAKFIWSDSKEGTYCLEAIILNPSKPSLEWMTYLPDSAHHGLPYWCKTTSGNYLVLIWNNEQMCWVNPDTLSKCDNYTVEKFIELPN